MTHYVVRAFVAIELVTYTVVPAVFLAAWFLRRTLEGSRRWDGESFCVEGCGRPATHERLIGMTGDDIVVELVCDRHR